MAKKHCTLFPSTACQDKFVAVALPTWQTSDEWVQGGNTVEHIYLLISHKSFKYKGSPDSTDFGAKREPYYCKYHTNGGLH